MKNLLKIIALLLCVCSLSFAATCGGSNDSNGSDKNNAPTQSADENSGENSSENSSENGSESGSGENSSENSGEGSSEGGSQGGSEEDSGVWTPPAKM